MTTSDPISLAQAQRLSANADTILLRATRPADLETPIGAFLRLDDGGPAYLLESVEGGERLGRYSFLGVGPRRLLEVRDGVARVQTRPVTEPVYSARTCRSRSSTAPIRWPRSAPSSRAVASSRPRACRGSPAGPSARWRTTRCPPSRPTVPLPDRDPVGVPTAAFIETDLVLVFDHLTHTLSAIASLHTEAPEPRGALPDRREGDLRCPRADVATQRERDGRFDGANGDGSAAAAPARAVDASDTSLGRDEYIHAVEVAKDAIAAGEAIQVVLARRQSFGLPTDPATGAPARRHRALPRPAPGQSEPVPVLHPDADLRGRRRIARVPPPGRGRPPDHAPDRRHAPAWRGRPRGRPAVRGAPGRPEGTGGARDARRSRAQRPRARGAARDGVGQQVHGGRALQPRPPSRLARRGAPEAGSRRARRTALGLPGGHAVGRAQGPRDAAHRGGRRGAPRAVRRRGRLSRLRRQPRHGDHHPQRGAQGRPGARPHRCGYRGGVGPREGVRGDRAQGGGAPARDRAGRGHRRGTSTRLGRGPRSRRSRTSRQADQEAARQ